MFASLKERLRILLMRAAQADSRTIKLKISTIVRDDYGQPISISSSSREIFAVIDEISGAEAMQEGGAIQPGAIKLLIANEVAIHPGDQIEVEDEDYEVISVSKATPVDLRTAYCRKKL